MKKNILPSKKYTTFSPEQTKVIARLFSKTLSQSTILCLAGDLGSGKTTFTQGLLEYFGAQPPFSSPTFSIIKEYPLLKETNGITFIYHIDAYRITSTDILNLGWKEMIKKPKTLILIEWPENIKECLPLETKSLFFLWKDDVTRIITLPYNPEKDNVSTIPDK